MNILGFLLGFGCLQGFILAVVLVSSSTGMRRANVFMAGLVCAISLRLLQMWLVISGYFTEAPQWALFMGSIAFTWGPLLYLYAITLTGKIPSWKHVLHLVPFAFLALSSLQYYALNAEEKQVFVDYIWYHHTDPLLEDQFRPLVSHFWFIWLKYRVTAAAFVLHFGIYCLLVIHRINQHNRLMQHHFSSLEKLNLRWLRVLTSAGLLYILLLLALNRVPRMLFDDAVFTMNYPFLFLVLLIYAIAIAALYQPSIIHGVLAARVVSEGQQPVDIQEKQKVGDSDELDSSLATGDSGTGNKEANGQREKYSRSGISLDDAQQYKVRLMEVARDQQLYLDSELTLPDLAEHAGITPHQVSQVLNGQLGQNFFTFINYFRISYAKELLANTDKSHLAVVDIAMEVGFKSKSSFYDAFKKATQLTPAQYRKNELA